MKPVDGTRLCRDAILAGQRPDSAMTVSQWADTHRMLSQITSAEPGIWRTERTPYLREIMDTLSISDSTTDIVFMKGSQIGGSETGLNFLGYIIDHAPGPVLLVQPTIYLAERFSKQRIDSMFRDTKRLHDKVREKKSRDSSNTALMKEFDGGILVIAGANAASALKSMPCRYVILDETDSFPDDCEGEGDPIKLARARARTFTRKKIFQNSSPTIEGQSKIAEAYKKSDRRRFYVPCPHCSFAQPLVFDRLKWEGGDPKTVHYLCAHCERRIEESSKTAMLEAGRWVKENPDPHVRVAGFHLNALYSPVGFLSWREVVEEFLQAKDNPSLLRVFVNTILAETWTEKGDAPDWQRLFERREPYRFNVVPRGGLLLTAGADVQKDRIEVEIKAWGEDKQSWSIDYRVIIGDTSDSRTFHNLDCVLDELFAVEGSKARLQVRMLAIDSGFNTQAVYNYVREMPPSRVVAIKGMDNMPTLVGLPSVVDISYGGKRFRRGVRVWPVGTNHIKSELYGWLRLLPESLENPVYPPGYCHFPEYPEEYFKMLTAEQIVRRRVRGYWRYMWEKTRERNESLDTSCYARAAAAIIGLDRFTDADWTEMKSFLSPPDVADTTEMSVKQKTRGGIPIRQSDFW